MICSARELGLGEDHAGIIVLATLGLDPEVGTDARELLGPRRRGARDQRDARPRVLLLDARGRPRVRPVDRGRVHGPRAADERAPPAGGGFAVEIDDAAPLNGVPGADRFVAQIVRGVRANDPSPAWMQRRLQQAGMRPIGLAVDVTNYVMLDLGQPLHAYDLAHLAEPIVVRRASPGEKIRTLDDVERALDPEDLLITDSPDGARGSRPIGLAAVMGGGDSEVSAGTTDLLVEAAHFDPITVARTARRHKLPSEAAKRFERGVGPGAAAGGRGPRGRAPRRARRRRRGPAPHRRRRARARPGVRRSTSTCPRGWSACRTRPTRCARRSCRSGARSRTSGPASCACSRRRGAPTSSSASTSSRRSRGCAATTRSRRSCRPHRRAPVSRAGQRTRRSVARALAESGLVEVLSYPFVGTDAARRARSARRRRPAPGRAAGQPAVRRAAVHADEPAGHAAGHGAAQRRPRGERRGGLRARAGHPTGRRRARRAATARGRAPVRRRSSRRSTPPCRRSRAASRGCWRGCASPPAGGVAADAPTTPTRSRRPGWSPRWSASSSS